VTDVNDVTRALMCLVGLSFAACTSDGEKRPDGGDAGSEAPAAVADAGDIPVVEEAVDAGHMADQVGKDAGVVVDGHAPVDVVVDAGAVVKDPKDVVKPQVPPASVVWNRVMVKAKSKDSNAQALQELVEDVTKAKTLRVRRTAGTFWLIEFEPTNPPRQKPDQEKLIAALQATGAFAVVEGDQLLQLK
jgi:hypothetical protein